MLALALAAGVVGLASAGAAVVGAVSDPDAAVAYQQNPAHDGSSGDTTFVAPFAQAWTKTFNGKVGYPLIADGRVFVTVAPTYDFGNQVVALAVTSGEVLWGPVAIGGNSETGSIAYDSGRVFAVDSGGGVTAFDAASGVVVWDTQLPDQWVFSAPLTAADGTLYVEGDGTGGTLYALDESTGELMWSAAVSGGGKSAPAVDDTGVYVTYGCGEVFKFDLAGNSLWHHSGTCIGGAGTTPVLHDGRVWVREFAGDPPYLLDAVTGAELPGTFDAVRAPAFDGRLMATVGGGILTVSDALTGEVVWQAPTAGHVLAPLIANHYVISARSDGIIEARLAQSGVLVWSGQQGSLLIQDPDEMGSNILAGMAQGDGTLVVPGEKVLTAFVPSGASNDTTPPTVRLWPFRPRMLTTARALARWRPVDERSGVLSSQLRTRQGRVGFPMPAWTVRRHERTGNWSSLPIDPRSRLCVSVRSQDGVGNWSDWTPAECVRRPS